jgi:hypothetical protein
MVRTNFILVQFKPECVGRQALFCARFRLHNFWTGRPGFACRRQRALRDGEAYRGDASPTARFLSSWSGKTMFFLIGIGIFLLYFSGSGRAGSKVARPVQRHGRATFGALH